MNNDKPCHNIWKADNLHVAYMGNSLNMYDQWHPIYPQTCSQHDVLWPVSWHDFRWQGRIPVQSTRSAFQEWNMLMEDLCGSILGILTELSPFRSHVVCLCSCNNIFFDRIASFSCQVVYEWLHAGHVGVAMHHHFSQLLGSQYLKHNNLSISLLACCACFAQV